MTSVRNLVVERDALRHALTGTMRWTECVGDDENGTRETCSCGGCIAYRKGQAALAAVRDEIRAEGASGPNA